MHENFADHRSLSTPRHIVTSTRALIERYQSTHDGHFPATHDFAGNNSERASVGLPGHCWICAVVGHVEAHPKFGCGDVRCNVNH